MHRFTIVVLSAFLTGGIIAAESANVYELGVDGMSCPFCAFGLEKKLKKVDGVASIEIDLDGARVILIAKTGTELDEKKVREAVKKAGFTVRSYKQIEAGDAADPGLRATR